MNKARVAILSSVRPGIFSNFPFDERFTPEERQKALMSEVDVWKDTMPFSYIHDNTVFEVVNVLEGVPRRGEYDGYILGGSPSMVTERAPWMIDLERFMHSEIDAGKSAIGFCFGHQILASSFGGTVENAPSRKIGAGEVFLNTSGMGDKLFSQMGENFNSIWSHRQFVSNTGGEIQTLGNNEHTPNQIIKIGDNAWGCQFHPEFTREFCSFLVKLMSGSITSEGQNPEEILKELEKMKGNESSRVVTLFVDSILKK